VSGEPYPVSINIQIEQDSVKGPSSKNRGANRSGSPLDSGVTEVERFVTGSGTTLRLSPWRGNPQIVQVVATSGPGAKSDDVAQVLEHLTNRDVQTVVTTALGSADQQPFLACSFTPHEHLVLLHRLINQTDPNPKKHGVRHYFAQRSKLRVHPVHDLDHDAVLDLDRRAFAAFSTFWQFDALALDEARWATDAYHCRLTRSPSGEPTGHALTGRTASIGFIQRLAVDPLAQGCGIGSALVVDALRWLRLVGAREAWVNTQPDNDSARSLYLRHGFIEQNEGLVVLHWSKDSSTQSLVQ